MKILELAGATMRRLNRDEQGLTGPEMIMLAALIMIPVVIALTAFGDEILGWMKDKNSEAEGQKDKIKWN